MAGETTATAEAGAAYPVYAPIGGQVAMAEAVKTVATAELQLADVWQMVKVPQGARVIGGFLQVDDLDSSTGLTLSVGDGVSDARYVSASNVGQAGGTVWFGRTATLGDYTYPGEDTIDVKVAAAATGAQSGKVRMVAFYRIG